jgi:hypothetical protein
MAKCGSDPTLYPNYGCQCSGPSCDCTKLDVRTYERKQPASGSAGLTKIAKVTGATGCGDIRVVHDSGPDFVSDFEYDSSTKRILGKVAPNTTSSERTGYYQVLQGNDCGAGFDVTQEAGPATP